MLLEKVLFPEQKYYSAKEKVSLLPCPGPGSSYLATIFLHLALERMREVGPVSFVCSTILPGPGKGMTRDLESVTRRLVPIFFAQCLTHTMLLGGAGWGMEDGWKKIGTCWKSTSSLERGLWVVLGQTRTDIFPIKSENPHVRMRSCQNASPHCTFEEQACLRFGAGYWGENGK